MFLYTKKCKVINISLKRQKLGGFKMDSVIQSVDLIDSLIIKYIEYLKTNFTSI